jgi:hypothetical protein
MRYRSIEKDPSMTFEQKTHLIFHLKESRRIRNAVLAKANLAPPRPAVNNNIPGKFQNYLRRVQWELWRWKSNLAILMWPSSMETALNQVFAQDSFRRSTMNRWSQYFQLTPSGIASILSSDKATPVPFVTFHASSNIFGELDKDPPGEVVRRRVYDVLTPTVREELDAYLPKFCSERFKQKMLVEREMKSLQHEANAYLAKTGERNTEWENKFAEAYDKLDSIQQKLLGENHACDEWFKVIHGRFPVAGHEEGFNAALHILRLAEVNKGTEVIKEAREVISRMDEIVRKTQVSETEAPAPQSQTEAQAETIVAAPEEKEKRVEKKSDEKRNDENGVENG